jgi:hypothetical protein
VGFFRWGRVAEGPTAIRSAWPGQR